MALFENSTRHQLVITSFKVMYTTMCAQDDFRELYPIKKTTLKLCLERMGIRSLKKHMLVRHPQNRIISFFNDKFRYNPLSHLETSFERFSDWQNTQKLFFPDLGISPAASPEKIAETMLKTSITTVINLLPGLMHADQHLQPQVASLTFKCPYVSFNFDPVDSIKIESMDRQVMAAELGIDTGIKRNISHTKVKKTEVSLTDQAMIESLYAADFRKFGYSFQGDGRSK